MRLAYDPCESRVKKLRVRRIFGARGPTATRNGQAARDAATGASIQGNDVRVILSAERQADTTRSLPASLAYESPGTYTVVLEVPGYLRWERTGIRVRADQCHVTTVQVTADLRREG